MKKTSRILTAAAIALTLCSVCGCKAKTVSEPFKEMVQEFKGILLPYDEMAALHQEALAGLNAFLEQPDEEHRLEAVAVCQEMEGQIEAVVIPDYEMSVGVRTYMEKRGIDTADFMVPYHEMAFYQESYAQDIDNYLAFLKMAKERSTATPYTVDPVERLQLLYEINSEYEWLNNECMYYGMNLLFADLNEKEMEYFKSEVLAPCKMFHPSDVQWESDARAAEKKMESCYTQMEELYEKLSRKLGEAEQQE